MKAKIILCLALMLSGVLLSAVQADGGKADSATRMRLEQMAQTYSHFSLTVVVHNRPLRLASAMELASATTNGIHILKPGTNVLAAEQLRLVKELRELSGDQNSLVVLLQHPDPKVRTLALGAIFEREDGRDLPSIATLINDSAPTFPNLHESLNQPDHVPLRNLKGSIGSAIPLAFAPDGKTVYTVARQLEAWRLPGI